MAQPDSPHGISPQLENHVESLRIDDDQHDDHQQDDQDGKMTTKTTTSASASATKAASGNDNNNSKSNNTAPTEPSLAAGVEDVLRRSHALLHELDQFEAAVKEARVEKLVDFRAFRTQVRNEIKIIERLSQTDGSEARLQHKVNSSNLPYLETVWAAAKRSTGLVQFRKWFYWGTPPWEQIQKENNESKISNKHPPSKRDSKFPNEKGAKKAVIVDIVSSNGRVWQKVITYTTRKILFEMAKQGWQNDSDSDSDLNEDANSRDDNNKSADSDSDSDEISLLRTAKDLSKAARANRFRNRRPEVHFILPRVERGLYTEIDRLLDKIAATGAIVSCGGGSLAEETTSAPDFAEVLPRLVLDQSHGLSEMLNLDCTILLALVSDISHAAVTVQDWYPSFVKRQIEMEKEVQLLPATLYPTMGRHPLVCTEEAADTMRHIVDTIGTDTEKERTRIVLGDDQEKEEKEPTPNRSREQLLDAFQTLSNYPVPRDWQLPIKIVASQPIQANRNEDKASEAAAAATPLSLPPPLLPTRAAAAVAAELSDLNKSIFFYGWATRTTTLSSNGVVAKQIERIIAETMQGDQTQGDEDEDEEWGPDIWTCKEARSLIARKPRGVRD